MPHSWLAYTKAEQITKYLIEAEVLNDKGLQKLKTIQGSIQIILETVADTNETRGIL